MVLVKRSMLILLLLALCVAMGMVDSAETRGEFLFYGSIMLALIVVIFAPARWWLNKG